MVLKDFLRPSHYSGAMDVPKIEMLPKEGKKWGSQRIMMKSITSSDQKENLESSVTNVLQFFCCNFL